jgi:uncharacterized phage-associated protein
MKPESTLLEQLLKEIADLREAKAILESVWMEVGAYGKGSISDKTQDEMRGYHQIQNSE